LAQGALDVVEVGVAVFAAVVADAGLDELVVGDSVDELFEALA
jgi:hypothetical protein